MWFLALSRNMALLVSSDAKAAVDAGLISEEDFVRLKNRLIDGPSSTTTDNEKTDLAKHFRDAERRTHQPWRLQQEKFTNIRETWMKMSLETKRAMFLDKARNHTINPTEAMLSIYLLYGGEAELDFLRSLLVCSTGPLRLLMHNM